MIYIAAITYAFPVPSFLMLPAAHNRSLPGFWPKHQELYWALYIKKSSKVTCILTFLLKGGPTNLLSPGLQVKTSGVLLGIMMGVKLIVAGFFFLPLKKKISALSPQHVIRAQRAINNEMAHQLYVLQVLTFNLLEDRMMTKMDPQDQVSAH